MDPTLLNARLYLATAYAQLYVPGGESEDNVKIAKQAIEELPASWQWIRRTPPLSPTSHRSTTR